MNTCAFGLIASAVAAASAAGSLAQPGDAAAALRMAGAAAVVLASLWLIVAAMAKRLHDFNRSALWMFTVLIPGLNLLTLFVLVAWNGTGHANSYGEPPAGNYFLNWLAFLLLVLVPIGLVPAVIVLFDTHFGT